MTPQKRMDFATDPATVAEVYVHEWHAEIAEYRLAHEGVKPELLAYVQGIGEASR